MVGLYSGSYFPFDESNRRNVVVSPSENVVHYGDDDNSAVHHDAPVHRHLVHGGSEREESEDEHRE